jgi:hypothetical protein
MKHGLVDTTVGMLQEGKGTLQTCGPSVMMEDIGQVSSSTRVHSRRHVLRECFGHTKRHTHRSRAYSMTDTEY